MKIKMLGTAAVLAILAMSAAPAQAGALGCLVGAGAGGFGGAQIGGGTGRTIATIAGSLIGCSIGSNIQNNDNSRYQQRSYGYRNGGHHRYVDNRYYEQYDWRNSPRLQAANYSYNNRVVVRQPTQQQIVQVVVPQGPACSSGYTREYTTTVTVGGKQVPGYGTACYKPDGSWELGTATPVR